MLLCIDVDILEDGGGRWGRKMGRDYLEDGGGRWGGRIRGERRRRTAAESAANGGGERGMAAESVPGGCGERGTAAGSNPRRTAAPNEERRPRWTAANGGSSGACSLSRELWPGRVCGWRDDRASARSGPAGVSSTLAPMELSSGAWSRGCATANLAVAHL
jgi:hypothetical protein